MYFECNRFRPQLLSVSARALKSCMKHNSDHLSFERIHAMNNRATPHNYMLYKHSLLLFKIYNTRLNETEWLALNDFQILTSRQLTFKILQNHSFRVEFPLKQAPCH